MEEEVLFLTAKEGYLITGLRPATLRKMAWEGRIRSFKIMGAVRFKRADLEALITERPVKDPVDVSAA